MIKKTGLAIIFAYLALISFVRADEKPSLVYWNSTEGVILRSEIAFDADYWQLIPSFTMQTTQTFCAVASAVTVLNALPIKKPVDPLYEPFPYFTQNNFFSPAVTEIINRQTVLAEGITRDQLAQALEQQGVNVENIAGERLNNETLRNLLQKALGNDGRFVLINYARATLGQIGGGHWSVLAAFDEDSDRVLILDVATYKYPPVWVEIKTLQQAMATLDSTSQKSRGLLIVSQK